MSKNQGRGKYAAQREVGLTADGKPLTSYSAGRDGYVRSTYAGDGSNKAVGKTTMHAQSGDLHHHGSHSSTPTKGNFSRGNQPGSSSSFLSSFFKK
ncbi:MAG: hypothetical protein RIE23_07695 [Pontimonas sp.]